MPAHQDVGVLDHGLSDSRSKSRRYRAAEISRRNGGFPAPLLSGVERRDARFVPSFGASDGLGHRLRCSSALSSFCRFSSQKRRRRRCCGVFHFPDLDSTCGVLTSSQSWLACCRIFVNIHSSAVAPRVRNAFSQLMELNMDVIYFSCVSRHHASLL